MSIIFSHPTGNANVRAAAASLAGANRLAEFHTTIASFPGSTLDRLGTISLLSDIRRRRFDSVLRPYIHSSPWREVGRFVASKAGLTALTKHETGPFSIDAVYQALDRRVASGLKQALKSELSAVYAYEDGAVFSFREAKRLGIQCLYDLPTGYWRAARRLLETERERWPDWESTIISFSDSTAKLARKDEELRLADRIFVASQFVAKTIEEFPGTVAPVKVIPYGFPPVSDGRDYSIVGNSRPLKLLFVGMLSQQKGIANLFAAVEGLGRHVELTVVGRKSVNDCRALDTALAKHRWIPSLPHDEVLQLMREQDVLAFPSLFEGFGLVITEAMSQGTPVITTDRTAGPDLITHGRNGWLIEAGSTSALRAAIEQLLHQPQEIIDAGLEAMETARRRPWSVYGQELIEAIMDYQPA